MNSRLPARLLTPRTGLETLIDRHGATAVTWSLIRLLLLPRKRRARPPDAAHLSPHMRRDIGLPPLPPDRRRYTDFL